MDDDLTVRNSALQPAPYIHSVGFEAPLIGPSTSYFIGGPGSVNILGFQGKFPK